MFKLPVRWQHTSCLLTRPSNSSFMLFPALPHPASLLIFRLLSLIPLLPSSSSLPDSCWPSLAIGPHSHLSTCKDSTPSSTPPLPRPRYWGWAWGERVLPCPSAWRWRRRKLRPSYRRSAPPPCWRPQDSGCSAWWPTTPFSCRSSRIICGCALPWTTPRTDWWGCGRGPLLSDWGKRATCMRCCWPACWHQS